MAETQSRIELEIVTPAGVVLRQDVDEVEAPGVLGHFGVLPGHRPFMSQLRAGQLRFRTGSEDHFVAVHWGFAEVLPNKVTVLVETAEVAEDIDLQRAESAKSAPKSDSSNSARPTIRKRLMRPAKPTIARRHGSTLLNAPRESKVKLPPSPPPAKLRFRPPVSTIKRTTHTTS